MPEENWVEVGTATTNRIPDSNVEIFLDLNGPPICPNMTDAEFRTMVLKSRDKAVTHVEARLLDLRRWSEKDQARVALWFGSSGSGARERPAEWSYGNVTRTARIGAEKFCSVLR